MFYGDIRHFVNKEIHPAVLAHVATFLKNTVATLSDGTIELDNGVYAVIKPYTPGPEAEKRYESHCRYVDVQYVIEGGEIVMVTPLADLPVVEDRLADDDVRFHAEPKVEDGLAIPLRPGLMLVLMPEDAHKPECHCGWDKGRKCIVKIPMELFG